MPYWFFSSYVIHANAKRTPYFHSVLNVTHVREEPIKILRTLVANNIGKPARHTLLDVIYS